MRLQDLIAMTVVGLAATALPGDAASQEAADLIGATRASFVEVADWIVRAAELVPEDRYGYRPAEGVRTFGELVGHVADGNNWFCARAAGTPIEWAETVAQSGAGKAGLMAELRKSVEACTAAHTAANAARGPALIANYGHASLHYGNIVTYLRMLGLTPPSS